ncbi:hypothetical protein [Streptomyces sp. CBMA152]|uniref:hypothetical protein n=1 Tax=Streptomyces sp. CBMA152 TaxID=1896312 RepID=UPI0016603CC0|nr:hypothetical protein [Streptomyces sp. CBMA152]MBD0745968.1 hypothetical protein [Streptomyces sp. CBMA152]
MPTGTPAPLSLEVLWGSEKIQATNIAHRLPTESMDAQVTAVTAAGRANPDAQLPDGCWAAIARATSLPHALAHQLHPATDGLSGLLMVENLEGATLHSGITRVLLSELIPGPQPRTGMSVTEVPDPQVHGLTQDGRPSAALQYRYRSFAHLRDHVWQTVHDTLSLHSYASSILTRSVTRNLIIHPVEIVFEDGTEPIHALVVRDGITRLASAWAVLAGHGADKADVAGLARDALLGTPLEGLGQGRGSGLAQRLEQHRKQWRRAIRDEFDAELKGAAPGQRAAEIAQSYVVPAQIAVGVEGHAGRALSPEDVFDDAIRSVLASVHVEFQPWNDAAQNVEVITRALKRVIQLDDPRWSSAELQDVYGLATGRIPVTALPEVFGGAPQPPGTALWRAVYLVNALTQPDMLELLKDQAKAIKGGKRMSMKGFGDLLGPIIDLPWRSKKKLVTTQARNAWKNGGVLTGIVTGEWRPAPTADFTTLVAPALAGDTDARCTLAVAGGVALIADKLLTRNVGSSLGIPKERGGVPFRTDVSKVVEGLSRQDNELGLWTLALAANTFRENALPQNAVTRHSLTAKESAEPTETPYVYFKVDLDAPDKIARNADGVPVLLYEWDVVAASDPDRADRTVLRAQSGNTTVPAQGTFTQTTEADSAGGDEGSGANGRGSLSAPDAIPATFRFGPTEGGTGESHPALEAPAPAFEPLRPPSQRAAEHRKTLRLGVQAARDALDDLHALEPEVGSHTPIVPIELLDDLHKLLIGIQTDVENLRRRITDSLDPEESDLEDPDDSEVPA